MNGYPSSQRMAEQHRQAMRRMAEQQERLRKLQEQQLALQRRNQEMGRHYQQTHPDQGGTAGTAGRTQATSLPAAVTRTHLAERPGLPDVTTQLAGPVRRRAHGLAALGFSLVTLIAFAVAGTAIAQAVARSYRSDAAGFLAAAPVWMAGLALAAIGGRWLWNRRGSG